MWWLAHRFGRFLVPLRCVACDGRAESLLCEFCSLSSGFYPDNSCPGCGSPLSSARKEGLWRPCSRCDVLKRQSYCGVHVSWEYRGAISDALKSAKLGSRMDKASTLAALGGMNPPPSKILLGVDVVVPVPPSPDRLRSVGFDLVTEMAAVWARCLERPLELRALRRLKGPSQTRLSPSERRVRAMENFEPGSGRNRLKGKKVLVVDDIRTTGSTLNAVAKHLRTLDVGSCAAWVLCGRSGG